MNKVYALLMGLVCLSTTQSIAQSCNNEDFEDGNISGWTGYTGSISYNGSVTINTMGISDGRHTITSGQGLDEIASLCNIDIPTVAQGGLFSLRLGNPQVGAQAERVTKTFVVQPGKEFFLYKYAVVLEDPQHQTHQQPRFEVRVFDQNGNLAPCGVFRVRAGPNAANDGFQLCEQGYRKYWVKNWTVAGADLSAYVGQQITVEFLTTDCALGGHAGYAYVEASCEALDVAIDGFCPGSTEFTASVTEGFQTYEWSNGQTGPSATYQNLTFGDTVKVKVSTFTGCSTEFFEVLGPPDTVNIDPGYEQEICFGEQASITATGENVGYFHWPQLNVDDFTVIVQPDSNTYYTYEAFDMNGCPTGLIDSSLVKVRSYEVDTTITHVTCQGVSDGAIDVFVTGAQNPIEFVWSTGDSTASISGLSPGIYHVDILDGTPCGRSLDIEVIEPSGMEIDSVLTQSQCTLNNGTAEVIVTGGVGNYTYYWPHSGDTTQAVDSLVAGTYQIEVRDDFGNGCIRIINLEITEPEIILNTEFTNARCVINDGAATVVPIGGSTGNYFYLWSDSSTTASVDSLEAGLNWIYVYDEHGCEAYDTLTIAPPPSPISLALEKKDATCSFSDGEGLAIISGGLPPYAYTWENGTSTDSIYNLTVGFHSVTINDANDCSLTDSLFINDPPPLMELELNKEDNLCNYADGSAEVAIEGGTAPFNILWTNEQSSPTIDSLGPASYAVVVIDSNSCEMTDSIEIFPPDNLMELVIGSAGESYGLSNGSAYVEVYRGTPPYSYLWQPTGKRTSEINEIVAGEYLVIVTDQNNCQVDTLVTVEEIPPINIPNAFTPNGDVVNETWILENIELYPNADIEIFNRWGEQIFISKGYQVPWNGHSNGKAYPSDTYYYIIELNIGLNKPFVGYVDIIK